MQVTGKNSQRHTTGFAIFCQSGALAGYSGRIIPVLEHSLVSRTPTSLQLGFVMRCYFAVSPDITSPLHCCFFLAHSRRRGTTGRLWQQYPVEFSNLSKSWITAASHPHLRQLLLASPTSQLFLCPGTVKSGKRPPCYSQFCEIGRSIMPQRSTLVRQLAFHWCLELSTCSAKHSRDLSFFILFSCVLEASSFFFWVKD